MRATRLQLGQRRKKLLQYSREGVKPSVFCEIISIETGFPFDTIKKDWENKRYWIGVLFEEKAAKCLVFDLFCDIEIALEEANREFEQASANMKAQALSQVSKLIQMKMKFLEDFGILDRVKKEVEIKQMRLKKVREEKKRDKLPSSDSYYKQFSSEIDEAIDLNLRAKAAEDEEIKKVDLTNV